MSILPYLLFGFICALIVVFIFISVFFLVVACSRNKDQENQEQIKWIEDYRENQERKEHEK